MRNTKRMLAVAAGVTAVVAIGGAAGIASADTAEPKALDYVDGLDDINDDWNDHPEELGGALCENCDNSSGTDLVILWQSVLVVNGHLDSGQIDGVFGPDTAEATAMWQELHGLEVTEQVAAEEWQNASEQLTENSDGTIELAGVDDNAIQFTRADDADGTYTLEQVTYDGEEWTNTNGGKIELFNQTITLELA